MSVEQVADAIRKGDTIAARQDIVVAAYDRLWREALAAAQSSSTASLEELNGAFEEGHRQGYDDGWRDAEQNV